MAYELEILAKIGLLFMMRSEMVVRVPWCEGVRFARARRRNEGSALHRDR